MPVIRARHYHASVFVGDDRAVHGVFALNVAARVGELGDFMATAMVDVDLAVAHLLGVVQFFRELG